MSPNSQSSTSQLNLYELHYNLGHVLHQQGDLAGAAQSYRQVIALQPDYVNAHLNLAIVLDEQAQYRAAIHHYRQVIALQPNWAQPYNNMGCALVKLKEFDAAVQTYHRAIELNPAWATPYTNLGQALQSQGKTVEAIESYQRAIELQPDSALAHYNLGKALQSLGHHAKAITAFQQTIQLDPDSLPAYSECSVSWMAQGKLKQALPCLRESAIRQSKFIEAYWQWTMQLSDRGSEEARDATRKETADPLMQARIACGQFLRTLQHQPDSPALYSHLAQTYLHLAHTLCLYGGEGQLRQAQTYYQFVLQLQPNYLEAYLGLGDCLMQQDKPNAAILVYHLALKSCSQPIPLHVQLGQVLEKQEKFAEAIDHYRQALKTQSSDCPNQEETEIKGTPFLQNSCLERGESEEAASESIPVGIYSSTQNWVASTHPDSTDYIRLQFSPPLSTPPTPPTSPTPPTPSTSPTPSIPSTHPPLPPSSPACQGLNCQPCLRKLFDRFDPIHLGKGIYTFAMANQQAAPTQTPLFVTTIANGSVWTAPQQNHWLVCNATAVLTPDRYVLADLSRDYPGQLPGCQQSHPSQHTIFQLKRLPTLEKIDATVAVLTGLSGHNYYHWLVDILPRLALLQRSGLDLSQVDWFLVNSIRHPFQRETLEILGVPLEKVIASDRHPHIQATRLVVPSFAGYLGWLEPWALAFLRQQFLPLAQRSSFPYPERIYISRAKATHRRVLNEAEVIEQLSRYGFVSIQLESLSFVDQIALFAHAKIIVTPHGGGLTNMVFCHEETTIIELVNPHYIRHYYQVISQQLQLQHYLIVGEAFTCHPLRQLMYPSPLMEDIWVNPEALNELLQSLSRP